MTIHGHGHGGGGVITWAEVAAEHSHPPVREQRRLLRSDHIIVVHLTTRQVLRECLAGDGQLVAVQKIRHAGEQRRKPARVEEVLHEVLIARGSEVGLQCSGGMGVSDAAQRERTVVVRKRPVPCRVLCSLTRRGVTLPMSSKISSGSSMPSRPAMAVRCTTAFVEPPSRL